MTTTDAVTGAEQIQLAEHRGFALGLKAARGPVVSMKASDGVLDKSRKNLIATSLSIPITKACHGHPPPAPDAVAESDDWNTIGAGAMGHLREMYRPAYDALGSPGRTSLRNWINARVDRAIKGGWPT